MISRAVECFGSKSRFVSRLSKMAISFTSPFQGVLYYLDTVTVRWSATGDTWGRLYNLFYFKLAYNDI